MLLEINCININNINKIMLINKYNYSLSFQNFPLISAEKLTLFGANKFFLITRVKSSEHRVRQNGPSDRENSTSYFYIFPIKGD